MPGLIKIIEFKKYKYLHVECYYFKKRKSIIYIKYTSYNVTGRKDCEALTHEQRRRKESIWNYLFIKAPNHLF